MMRKMRIAWGMVLAVAVTGGVIAGGGQTASADELETTIRDLIDEISPSLVRVDYVTKGGFGVTGHEMKSSVTGIVVTDNGLVLGMDPVGGLLSMFGESETPSKPTDVKIVTVDGREFEAEFFGRDDEVNVSFYRVSDEEIFDVTPLPLSERVPGLAEQVVVIDILPESFSPRKVFGLSRINSVLEKPTKSYTTGDMSLGMYYGAPVVTLDGEVIGVVGQETIGTEGTDLESIMGNMTNPWSMFSSIMPRIIPTSTLQPLIDNPPTEEGTSKGWLGIMPQVLDSETAEFLGVGDSGGVLISKVFEDTPAEKAGLQPEDIITHIDGEPVDVHKEQHVQFFIRQVQRIEPGTLTKFTILRDGKEMEIGVTIAEKPKLVGQAETKEIESLGFTARELTFDTREAQKLDPDTTGVVVNDIDPAGPAGIAELSPGDIILKVDGEPVEGLEDFTEKVNAMEEAGQEETVFFVHRDGQTLFTNLKPEWEEEEQ
jgi:serine protease Do